MLRSIKLTKRIFDIFSSIFGLVITLPFWPMIAIAIKIDSSGSVFYSQRRVGIINANGKATYFNIIKFRTMVQNAEKDGIQWAKSRDPRITKVGHFLRVTRLDELPQLINVLKGEMSLIGPRPERPELYFELEKALPLYHNRTKHLKPGITGYAQVNLPYDSSINDVKNKISYDYTYSLACQNYWDWLRFDTNIIYKTILTMIMKKGR